MNKAKDSVLSTDNSKIDDNVHIMYIFLSKNSNYQMMMVLGIFQQSNNFQFEVLEILKRFLEQTQNAFDMAPSL